MQSRQAQMKNEMKRMIRVAGIVLALVGFPAQGQETEALPSALSLDDCRQMAISSNKKLDQQRAKLEMAGYDRKIAAANYFPKISAIVRKRQISKVLITKG